MIDYWEAIGRLACNSAMSEKFIAKFPQGHAIAMVKIAGQLALDIPADKLLDIQDFFAAELTEGTLSIMSAGELFWTFSYPDSAGNFRAICRFLQDHKGADNAHSTGYFMALAMIIIDLQLRNQILAKKPAFRRGPKMSATELDSIMALAVNPDFSKVCDPFRLLWPPGQMCFDLAVPSPGNPHPLPLRGEALPVAKGAGNY